MIKEGKEGRTTPKYTENMKYLGRLKRLTSLLLGENKLSGFIPPSLYIICR
jgi:hypothetical protein